jgi:NAD(P)-dependent dehydrogenase (short-subunit alcohol dehydrogenase family)
VLSLSGRVAFVSGVGSIGPGWGNGKATATLLARRGASVFGVDIVPDAAGETERIVIDEGNVCAVCPCDMTDPAEVEAAVAACVERFGRIDVLVNNVGGSLPGGPVEMSVEDWDRQVALNLKSAYLGCKFVLPEMLAQGGGAIVNLSSVLGIRQHPGRVHAAYSATKAGIIELSRSIAIQYADRGIRCNSVVPGLIHTPLVEARLVDQIGGGDAEALVAARHAQVPIGRMGDAWDVAHAILFLVSDEARYVTATELVVDGGLSAVTT